MRLLFRTFISPTGNKLGFRGRFTDMREVYSFRTLRDIGVEPFMAEAECRLRDNGYELYGVCMPYLEAQNLRTRFKIYKRGDEFILCIDVVDYTY